MLSHRSRSPFTPLYFILVMCIREKKWEQEHTYVLLLWFHKFSTDLSILYTLYFTFLIKSLIILWFSTQISFPSYKSQAYMNIVIYNMIGGYLENFKWSYLYFYVIIPENRTTLYWTLTVAKEYTKKKSGANSFPSLFIYWLG